MIGLLILFAIAGTLTTLWLGGAFVYISSSLGWENFLSLPPSDLALFILSATGPIAVLWLIIGYLQLAQDARRQERLLQRLSSQARRTSDHLEAQVRTLLQMQEAARRRAVEEEISTILCDLASHAAHLAERVGMITTADADVLWTRTNAGETWAFANAYLSREAAYDDFADMLAERLTQDALGCQSLQMFLRRYTALIRALEEVEAHALPRAVVEDGPITQLAQLFQKVQARIHPQQKAAAPETQSSPVIPKQDQTEAPSSESASFLSGVIAEPSIDLGRGQDDSLFASDFDAPEVDDENVREVKDTSTQTKMQEEGHRLDGGSVLSRLEEMEAPLALETRTVTESLSRLQSALAQLNEMDVPDTLNSPKAAPQLSSDIEEQPIAPPLGAQQGDNRSLSEDTDFFSEKVSEGISDETSTEKVSTGEK